MIFSSGNFSLTTEVLTSVGLTMGYGTLGNRLVDPLQGGALVYTRAPRSGVLRNLYAALQLYSRQPIVLQSWVISVQVYVAHIPIDPGIPIDPSIPVPSVPFNFSPVGLNVEFTNITDSPVTSHNAIGNSDVSVPVEQGDLIAFSVTISGVTLPLQASMTMVASGGIEFV